jgi:hypothetical protein
MPTVSNVIANPGFELGDTLWTKGTSWRISQNAGTQIEGQWLAQMNTDLDADASNSEILNENVVPVYPGRSITATCRVAGYGADGNVSAVLIEWLNSGMTRISTSVGNSSSNNSPGTWETSSVTAAAPAGAAYARIGAVGTSNSNGSTKVDAFSWNYVSDRDAELTSPADGATFTFGDSVLLKVTMSGTEPAVDNIVYYSDGVQIAEIVGTGSTSYNVTDLAVGTHDITATVTLVGGTEIELGPHEITISAVYVPPTTREFKASNAYTYFVGKNFSGLSKAMPLTALVTGVEVLLDYTTKMLIRSADEEVENVEGSNPNVIFDIAPTGTVEAVLLSEDVGTYTTQGSSITASIPFVRSAYDVEEEGTSEGKKWTVLNQTTGESMILGSETALFGQTSIAAADFLSRALAIRFYPNVTTIPTYADSGDACIRFFIDKLRVRIYFDAGSAEYYFASPDKTQIIKGNLVSSYVMDGDFETADAEGELQLNSELEVMDGTQTWIGDDWTIHAAYPPTDANQIGTVAARDAADGIGMRYNGLPSAAAVVENRSRYQFITANFFAVRQLDSIYGAHGLPRAFAYNGDFFYKIYTQPEAEKDQPRHVAYHHGHLALGFDDGRTDISVIGQPYNYDGALGASEWSIGDKVTGLLPLSGTILGIFGSKSIWGLNGTTVDNFSTQVITPNIGAIEYTVTDMGFPVYANAYGIYTLAQTQQYGDYLGTPMSQDISPWLRPRLVRKYTSDKEVVVAWPVRSKNQYRIAFADGYIMSMTLNAGQQSAPTFSFQQYNIYDESDE